MIDDKKIEEACDKALKNSVFNDNVHAYPYVRGFYDCAKWAFNEFRKDLWHPASEKPVPVMGCNNGVLVELNETKKPITLWKREYLYENISKHGNRFISRWLYIDDLFQKEGGEHD